MSEGKIVLFARLKVKGDQVERARSAALAIVEPSRNEVGCINYDIHQSIEDSTVFLWHETWVSKAALDEHFATKAFQNFFAVVGEVAAEPPEINISRMIS